MNAAVRAVVRMGIYVGCRVYLIREVSGHITRWFEIRQDKEIVKVNGI